MSVKIPKTKELISAGIEVEGTRRPYTGRRGRTVAMEGEGRRRRFRVLWSDNGESSVHARSLRSVASETLQSRPVRPTKRLPERLRDGADNVDHFDSVLNDNDSENDADSEATGSEMLINRCVTAICWFASFYTFLH